MEHGIDLTRMECKESYINAGLVNYVSIDLTRMECKAMSISTATST